MPRILHTSDWQLGMTRRFLNPDAQARYSQARIDCVTRIGRLARAEGCACVVIAGDMFEFENMDRVTVRKALDAMGRAAVPFLILPGNHDPHHDHSVYTSELFLRHCPGNVSVLADTSIRRPADDLEIVGAPWHSKHPGANPVIAVLAALDPAPPGVTRVCLAHGPTDIRGYGEASEAVIPAGVVTQAIDAGKIHYAALGDRHSADMLDRAGRVRYSGTMLATDFDEIAPGNVLIIDVSPQNIAVREEKIGDWTFAKLSRDILGPDDVDTLLAELQSMPQKETSVLRLILSGSPGLAADARLKIGLDDLALLFAGMDIQDNDYRPNTADAATLCTHLTGYAAAAAAALREMAGGGGGDAAAAQDALILLSQLAPADAAGGDV